MGKYPGQYKSNKNIVYSSKYHIVFCPKYRRPVLVGKVAERLAEILRQVCQERRCELFKMEVMPDHVHLLLEADPQFGVHRLVKLLKRRSSRLLRDEFPHLKSRLPTLWTNSYFLSTVGGTPQAAIKRYVEDQKNV